MTLRKLRITLAVTFLALPAVSAVDSALAQQSGEPRQRGTRELDGTLLLGLTRIGVSGDGIDQDDLIAGVAGSASAADSGFGRIPIYYGGGFMFGFIGP
jgi:hypothetical protein